MQYLRDFIVFIQFLNGLFLPSKTHRWVENMEGGGKVLIWDKQVLISFLKILYFQVQKPMQKQYFLERMKVALLRVLYQTSSSASPDCRRL